MLDDEMLTIDDLASYLKLKPQTIYKWAQTGKIPGAKFGKEWRFRRSTIEEWIDNRMAEYGVAGGNHSGRPRSDVPKKVANDEEEQTPPDQSRAKKSQRGRKDGAGTESN